uniref:C2 domain-containing protein n=1 Tax=Fibrocapsa japonica TaxID=94617 RepID=A0A7S2XY59_9STRA|mmetsp:Transcript_21835/g.31685  ORF Transcript_21835/g.31685 Transcript_21835/m.31685 type:complete len:259 (+) Transcript_21835:106-882(+)|eukprot:CAMPEP_0113942644 /NCGR_PEP_ID=MMETSP1339-20121228/8311_1 /TAXON_ID=94617 /ORGANISM="Fibrocapsa japonica" /LENGTH=258 /DNA_ID=CAMNT_0000947177 /DNA_START=55 /DNA_END=831 /DNA_ORIENTATION=- /assembly_acc=CAM_ASM_000762
MVAGNYIIQAFEGRDIKSVDFVDGVSDPYLVLKLDGQQIGKTARTWNWTGKNPKWNALFTTQVQSAEKNVLVVECWNKSIMKDDVLIGSATITLSDKTQTAWYPLKTGKGESTGNVRMACQFRPSARQQEESAVLAFMQEYMAFLYVLALVGVLVWRVVLASPRARLPIEAGLRINAGDHVASTSHCLYMKTDCSLELHTGVTPGEETVVWTNGVKAANCKKNSWATLTEEDQLTVYKNKKVYWSSNVADLPEFDGLM